MFYDDVQYDKHGWRNRNRIKTANGPIWLTVPVHARGVTTQGTLIRDVAIDWSRDWRRKLLLTVREAYARAPHFVEVWPLVEEIFSRRDPLLADLAIASTLAIARFLALPDRRFVRSSSLPSRPPGSATDRLAGVLRAVGATHYVSGPSARAYLDESVLAGLGVPVEFIAYDYPPYPQLHPPYEPQVSILDLLFMTGTDAGQWIWGGQPQVAAR